MIQPAEKITQHTLLGAIDRALDFLNRQQLPDGRFPVNCMMNAPGYSSTFQDESVFATSHIVYSLGYSLSEKAKSMVQRGLRFFQEDMLWPGVWRHWKKGSPKYSFIPPDLDDIACISFLLKHHGVKFPDNRNLLFLNRNRQGLFYTWLIPRLVPTVNPVYWWTTLRDLNPARLYFYWKKTAARRGDVDSIVNANVLLYLGQCEGTAAVIDYLIQLVREGREGSSDKWYQDSITFYYAISRDYAAGVKDLHVVREQTISRLESAAAANGCIAGNVLTTALSCCTLMNFDCDSTALHAGINYLLSTQDPDGSWENIRFYYGGPGRISSWGSCELTTGFCLEALERYHQQYLG